MPREPFLIVRCAHVGSPIIVELNTDHDQLAVEVPPSVAIRVAHSLLEAAMRAGLPPDPPRRGGWQLWR